MEVGFLWLWPALGEGSTKWRLKSRCWAQRGQYSGWGSSCPGVMAARSLAQAWLSWHPCGWAPVALLKELGLGLEQWGQLRGQAAVHGCSPRGCRAGKGCAGPVPWPAAWGSGAGTRTAGWAAWLASAPCCSEGPVGSQHHPLQQQGWRRNQTLKSHERKQRSSQEMMLTRESERGAGPGLEELSRVGVIDSVDCAPASPIFSWCFHDIDLSLGCSALLLFLDFKCGCILRLNSYISLYTFFPCIVHVQTVI